MSNGLTQVAIVRVKIESDHRMVSSATESAIFLNGAFVMAHNKNEASSSFLSISEIAKNLAAAAGLAATDITTINYPDIKNSEEIWRWCDIETALKKAGDLAIDSFNTRCH